MPEDGWEQRKAEYDAAITERLAIDPVAHHLGPLIDLKDVAILGGLAPGSPGMARQRTAKGQARVPFPDPDPDEGTRWEDKPLWRAYPILDYFKQTGNWPLGTAARPAQRRPRTAPRTPPAEAGEKITWSELSELKPQLAKRIKNAGLNDGIRRSPYQWLHRYRHRAGAK